MVFLVESVQKNNYTEIIAFSRNKQGKKVVDHINDFLPYFYVLESAEVPLDARIIKVEPGNFISINGDKLKKIYVRRSMDVGESEYGKKDGVRDLFPIHFEADIPFTQRYLIDKIGEKLPYKLKKLYMDIETNSKDAFPDMKNPNQEITSIAMVDSFDNKVSKLLLKNKKWDISTIARLQAQGNLIFDTEEQMLCEFINTFNRYDPDVISGYNVINFDLTYLIRRMKMLNVPFKKLSPIESVFLDMKYDDVVIKGRILFDVMANYMHFRRVSNQGDADDYSLERTSQDVLSKGKIEHEENFSEMWELYPEKLTEYNERDTILVKEIDEKLRLFDYYNQLRCMACTQIKSAKFASVLIDGLLLSRYHNKIIFPSKVKRNENKYSGAFVLDPIPGIYKNVLALDVSGMYPSIIKTFNLSYETISSSGKIKIDMGDNKVIRFSEKEGIIPKLVKDLGKERIIEKKKKKDATNKEDKEFHHRRQWSLKTFINSVYGYIGYPNSRLYKREVANAVTIIGKDMILHTISVLDKQGYKTIYSDTDSVYVQSKETELFNLIKEGNKLIKIINKAYKEFAICRGATNCQLEMEFEKIFKKIMFFKKKGKSETGAKKRYAFIQLWNSDGTTTSDIKFKGIQAKRSDSPKIARDLQISVINKILKENASKENIVEYITDIDKKIRDKVISDEDFGCPTKIKEQFSKYGKTKKEGNKTYKIGIPPVVAGGIYSNKYLGTRYAQGMKLKWVYVKTVPKGYPNTSVISFRYKIPDGFKPDYDKMSKKIFEGPLTEVFDSAGFGEFPTINSSNTNLSTWFRGKDE